MERILLELKWENGDSFQLTTKRNDEDPIVISRHEENGAIGELWGSIQKTCSKYFESVLSMVGDAMKEES